MEKRPLPAGAPQAFRRRTLGIGPRLTKRLNAIGIHSILDLSRADPVRMREKFSVVMMRTVLEPQGTPCIPMEEERIGGEHYNPRDNARRYGRSSIGLGHAGIRGGLDWSMKRDMRSPRYTTHWDEPPSSKQPDAGPPWGYSQSQ